MRPTSAARPARAVGTKVTIWSNAPREHVGLGRRGIPAIIANSRGAESLRDLVAALGPSITAGTVLQAASQGMAQVAVNWPKLPGALADLPDRGGRIVIDANNPVEAPLFRPAELNARASSEVVAGLVPGARLAKAFNHLPPPLLEGDPAAKGGRRVLFLSGDEPRARAEVAAPIERLGFFPVDLGTLASGARLSQFSGGPLPALNLVRFA